MQRIVSNNVSSWITDDIREKNDLQVSTCVYHTVQRVQLPANTVVYRLRAGRRGNLL